MSDDTTPSGLTWDDLAWLRGERTLPPMVAEETSAAIHRKIANLLVREERQRLKVATP